MEHGFNHFRLHEKGKPGQDGDLVFDRHGLSWKLAQIKVGVTAEAERQPIESPIGRWVTAGLSSAYDGPGKTLRPVRLRMMGATVPTHEIVGPLKMPFVLVPVVNADNNQHSYDENLRMGNFLTGMRSMLGLLTTPY